MKFAQYTLILILIITVIFLIGYSNNMSKHIDYTLALIYTDLYENANHSEYILNNTTTDTYDELLKNLTSMDRKFRYLYGLDREYQQEWMLLSQGTRTIIINVEQIQRNAQKGNGISKKDKGNIESIIQILELITSSFPKQVKIGGDLTTHFEIDGEILSTAVKKTKEYLATQ